jgi:hypothetical protein
MSIHAIHRMDERIEPAAIAPCSGSACHLESGRSTLRATELGHLDQRFQAQSALDATRMSRAAANTRWSPVCEHGDEYGRARVAPAVPRPW